jgi:TolA-binding protein
MHNQAEAHAALGQIGKARELLEAVVQQYPLTAPAVLARKNLKKMPEN